MAVQAGLSILATLLVFPESVGHQVQKKFGTIVSPLMRAMVDVQRLFDEPVQEGDAAIRLEHWASRSKDIRSLLLQSLAGIPLCRAQQHYLIVDISYSRLSGLDLRQIFDSLAAVQSRSAGLSFFFDVMVNNARHTHIDSAIFVARDASSRPSTRPPSVVEASEPVSEESPSEMHFSKHFPFLRNGSPSRHHKGSHISLLEHMRKTQQPVGLYESQRYMDIERAFSL
jgi:hypothetical protein